LKRSRKPSERQAPLARPEALDGRTPVTLAEQIAELRTLRAALRTTFADWIARGRIQPADAARRLLRIEAAIATLERVAQAADPHQPLTGITGS
jgi:hypothetical protein